MHRKFWSAMLSLAMVVSCFSGVALASGGTDQGIPSYQLTSPNNVNIDLKDPSSTSVVVGSSGYVTLSGAVMAQGTESPKLYMDQKTVQKFQTGLGLTPANADSRLVVGELKASSRNDRLYSNGLLTSLPSKTAGKYFVNEFVETDSSRLLTVGTDGRYSISFIPEVHTTKYIGFALKDLVAKVSNGVYGIYEMNQTGGSSDNYFTQISNKANAARNAATTILGVTDTAYTTAQNYRKTANDLAVAAQAALNLAKIAAEAYETDPGHLTWLGSQVSAVETAYKNIIDFLQGYSTTGFDGLIVSLGTASSAIVAYGTTYFPNLSGITLPDTTAVEGALTSVLSKYNSIDAIVFTSSIAQMGLVKSAFDAVYAELLTDGTIDTTLSGNLQSAITTAFGGGSSFDFIDDTLENALLDAHTAKNERTALIAAMQSYISAVDVLNASSGLGVTDPQDPANRYLQASPIQVNFKYKLKDSIPSYVAGTNSNIVVSGTFVTAEGNTIPYDFGYVVRAGGATGAILWTGRTSNGNFTVTINGVLNQEIFLYPTERYNPSQGKYDPIPAGEQGNYSYTIATFSRRAFYKADLEDSVFTATVTRKQVQFKDLYTYNQDDLYSPIHHDSPSTSVQDWRKNASLRLYGVSYAVYAGEGDNVQRLVKDYSIVTSGTSNLGNVDFSYGWSNSGTPAIIDSTSVTTHVPTFRLDDDGFLCFVDENDNPVPVWIEFASSGTATLRTDLTGRKGLSAGTIAENNELYRTLVSISVESPGLITVIQGNELKELSKDKKATEVKLHSLSDDIKTVHLNKITYDGKPNVTHTLVNINDTVSKDVNKEATDYSLVYAQSGNNISVWLPWDLVKVGGSNIEIQLDFRDADKRIVTSKTIVIKNSLWKVTSERDSITVQEDNTFSAYVSDQNDVEQNRARLTLNYFDRSIEEYLAESVIANIVGGKYTLSRVRPMEGGEVLLYVFESTQNNAAIKAMISLQALGKADYTATLSEGKDKVVTGLAKTLEFNATNASGNAAVDLTTAEIFGEDGKKNTDFAKHNELSLVHAGNGRYTISLVGLKPGTYILRASTTNMDHYVDIAFEVLPLTIEYTREGFNKLTWDSEIAKFSNFRDANKMSFVVKDPLTDAKVYVRILDDVKFVTDLDEESDMGTLMTTTKASDIDYNDNLYISDKDFQPYNFNSNNESHEFWVGLLDKRSDSVRASEGDLSLQFQFLVRENNSTGEEHEVDGMLIPIGLPSLSATPDKVVRGFATTITLTVTDANGLPASGVKIRPDVENYIAASTNANGETSYLFTAVTTGNSKRFDIAGFEGNAQVYAIVDITDDNEPPTIILDPYISSTTKSRVTITGMFKDNIGLSKFAVDNTMVNMSLVGETQYEFSFPVTLEYGDNVFRMVLTDAGGRNTVKTITITRNDSNVTIMTLNSTEVSSTDSRVTGLDVAPQIVDGRTCLPLRFIFESILGGTVDYADGVITAEAMGHNIVMTVGSNSATVDGKSISLLTAPFIDADSNRTLAPIREILQAIGVQVDFDAVSGRIILTGAGDVDVITSTDLVAPAGADVSVKEAVEEVEETEEVEESEEVEETEEVEEAEEDEEIVG